MNSAGAITIGARVHVAGLGTRFAAVVEDIDRAGYVVRRSSDGRRMSVAAKRVSLAQRRSKAEAPIDPELAARCTRERPPQAAPQPKPETGRDEDYLAYVRNHRCMVPGCHRPAPSDPHHWAPRGYGGGGTSRKVDDEWTVPLCRDCHTAFHATAALPGLNTRATQWLFLAEICRLLIAYKRRNSSGDKDVM